MWHSVACIFYAWYNNPLYSAMSDSFFDLLIKYLKSLHKKRHNSGFFFRSLKKNLQIHAHQLLILVLDIPINWTQDHTIGACQSLKNPVAHINGGLYIYIHN